MHLNLHLNLTIVNIETKHSEMITNDCKLLEIL